MPRLLYVVTHAMTARHLLRGQLAWMQARGFERDKQEVWGSNNPRLAYSLPHRT